MTEKPSATTVARLYLYALAIGTGQIVSCAPGPQLATAELGQLAAEPPQPPLIEKLGLQMLAGDEIRRLIVGKEIASRSYPSGIETSSTEIFTPHLTYVRRGDLVSSAGQYRIVGSKLCISYPAAGGECRRFYRDQAGNLFQEYVGSGSPELGKLIFR